MLNSRQRAQLRGMANGYDTILLIGKGGITDSVKAQAAEALEKRELIKAKVLENSDITSRQAADIIAESVGADVVQVIGSKFILYKESKDNKNIRLVK
ncbi:MAG: YhbY family RNA-binding protein [Clostridia bacterium]|nr:YhbY family RNA-binding protein [Clostridia bacterium]